MPQFSTSVVKKIIRKLGKADLWLQAKGGGKTSVTEADMVVRSLVSQPIFFAARAMVMMLTTIKGKCLMLNVTFCALATTL